MRNTLAKRKRTNHKPEFKARVALEALQEEMTMQQIADKYEIHINLFQNWKKELRESAADLFTKGNSIKDGSEKEIKDLREKVGELTMERDFLSKALGR